MSPDPTHPAALDASELLAVCQVRFTRRSGPGGQHRNKVETAVVLHHRPSGIEAEAAERRSQTENRRQALFRLRLNLALKLRCPIPPDEPPSMLWQSRCRNHRIVVSPEHDDFPALLAEALDRLEALNMDLRAAANVLACSASQLLKLLKAEPRALRLVNEHRVRVGDRPLR